jgi:hypothetical protein
MLRALNTSLTRAASVAEAAVDSVVVEAEAAALIGASFS